MSERRFGCEFEFSASWEKVEDAAKSSIPASKLVIDREWCRSRSSSSWILKTDSTTSAELTTPVCHSGDLRQVCNVARRLSEHRLYITHKDGFHVHVSSGRNCPVKMAKAWMDYEESILSMFPLHRRNNDVYCKRYVEHDLWMREPSHIVSLVNDHHAVMSYSKLRTFEFRIGEGTVDHEWIGAWVRLCMSFVNMAGSYKPQGKPRPLEELLKSVEVSHRDYRIFMQRRERFSPRRV